MTLNDILSDLVALNDEVDALQGEISDDIGQQLDAAEENFAEKVNSILYVIDKMRADAARYKLRAQTLTAHSKALDRRADYLQVYLLDAFRTADVTKISTEDYPSVSIRRNPPKILIMDEDTVAANEKYSSIIETIKIDKKAIAESLKRGEPVNGAVLMETERLSWR